ncbi:hypothetical protein RI129_001657 [Pyrocoelia pectoralis]|uniref:BTB domain-containing protein n=1 Tax=Pyrocoelia pectoralis TaxID=417401 RepID=A0AAN7VW22_9COLE
MCEESSYDDEIILEITNVAIKCVKKDLIKHSDYFKAMFEGNFVESRKKMIRLEGIDLKAMNIILSLLSDRTFLINEEDILSVLQVSCMLQFIEIKTMCISKLTELLLPRNCLKIWTVAEQLDLKPLYLKAKSMSLIEFDVIKDLECVTDLQLKPLCFYLGNTNLQCKNEMDVFQTLMKWWYENSTKYLKTDHSDIFVCFLRCLDFKNLLNSDLQEILTYPDIALNGRIVKILQCILDLRHKLRNAHDENVTDIAQLLINSKSRICKEYACILVNTCPEERKRKKLKGNVVYHDPYMRKRFYENIDSSDAATAIIYYDNATNNFVKFLEIDKEKCGNLDGFKIIGYKEFIFLLGGEYFLGKGNWNKNVWVYDTIRENWERKSVLPFERRHFECCVCGNFIYIISGTAKFRVMSDNMFWYNYKEDKWSKEIQLPCLDRPVRCCSWNNQLFLFCVHNKCGYVFDQQKTLWYKLNISASPDKISHFSSTSTVFSYKNHLYIRDNDCITELKLHNQSLVPMAHKQLSVQVGQHQSVVCDDVLYTLFKQILPEDSNLSMEKYCMNTQRQNVVFAQVIEGSPVQLHGDLFTYRMSTSIFTFQHYNLIEKDDFVN